MLCPFTPLNQLSVIELEKSYAPLLKGLSSGKTDLKQKMGISFPEKEPRPIIERCYGGYKVHTLFDIEK